jgi:hypothetical protein
METKDTAAPATKAEPTPIPDIEKPCCGNCAMWAPDTALGVDLGLCTAEPGKVFMIGLGKNALAGDTAPTEPVTLTIWPKMKKTKVCARHPTIAYATAVMLGEATARGNQKALQYKPGADTEGHAGFTRKPTLAEAIIAADTGGKGKPPIADPETGKIVMPLLEDGQDNPLYAKVVKKLQATA